jgi:hypothetical protein
MPNTPISTPFLSRLLLLTAALSYQFRRAVPALVLFLLFSLPLLVGRGVRLS